MNVLQKNKQISGVRAFVLTLGVFCQQGFAEIPRKLSTRLFLFTTIVCSLIIYQFYSSFIVSSLLTESPKTINTIRKLIDSRLHVGIEEQNYNYDFFDKTNDKVALELFKKKIEKQKNFFDIDEGVKRMHKGGFAFQVDTSNAYRLISDTFTEEEIC